MDVESFVVESCPYWFVVTAAGTNPKERFPPCPTGWAHSLHTRVRQDVCSPDDWRGNFCWNVSGSSFPEADFRGVMSSKLVYGQLPACRRSVHLKQSSEIEYRPEGPHDGRLFDHVQNELSKSLPVGRLWYGDNCAGDSDCHATASTLGSRHVPVSKPSRAAARGAAACVGN